MTETYSGRDNPHSFDKPGIPEERQKVEAETCRTTEELLALHTILMRRGQDLMRKKNSDYANPSASADPFRNFQTFGAFGILVRLSDKLARLRVFVEKTQQGQEMMVKDEKWEDTLIDAINYLVLLDGYIRTHGVK